MTTDGYELNYVKPAQEAEECARQVWPRDDEKVISRAVRIFERYGIRTVLVCIQCDEPLIYERVTGGYSLTCSHIRRVIYKGGPTSR